ncbi:MAG: hypothetical protein U0V74_04070 [Chitinophagales bacterium]
MKKIIATAFTGAALAFALNSCNNGGETQEQANAADNARIDSVVTAQLGGLSYDAECQAWIDSAATAQYDEWYATEGKKKGAKPAPKPKPKPQPEAPKPETTGNGKPAMGGDNNPNTTGQGKPKMGGGTDSTVGKGKPKMGGGPK